MQHGVAHSKSNQDEQSATALAGAARPALPYFIVKKALSYYN
jgi:hypothetical protein